MATSCTLVEQFRGDYGQYLPIFKPCCRFIAFQVFDNAATNWDHDEASARGLHLAVNQTNLTVTLIQDFYPAWRNWSQSQGSIQLLDNGNYLLGYGS